MLTGLIYLYLKIMIFFWYIHYKYTSSIWPLYFVMDYTTIWSIWGHIKQFGQCLAYSKIWANTVFYLLLLEIKVNDMEKLCISQKLYLIVSGLTLSFLRSFFLKFLVFNIKHEIQKSVLIFGKCYPSIFHSFYTQWDLVP